VQKSTKHTGIRDYVCANVGFCGDKVLDGSRLREIQLTRKPQYVSHPASATERESPWNVAAEERPVSGSGPPNSAISAASATRARSLSVRVSQIGFR
jgi:hypothetical protein